VTDLLPVRFDFIGRHQLYSFSVMLAAQLFRVCGVELLLDLSLAATSFRNH
jgi:hypothetical protein